MKGNWSEADYINITMPTAPTSSPIDVPAWAYAVIALVLLAIVAVPLVVGAVFIYRRYCFHRHIKTVSISPVLSLVVLRYNPHMCMGV